MVQKPVFEIQPFDGVGPVKLGAERSLVLDTMGQKPNRFRKTLTSEHATDAFYGAGFQVFYEGKSPQVESIELSRCSAFDTTLLDVKLFDFPIPEALLMLEKLTGRRPQTEDDGYSFELVHLGLRFWRPSNEPDEDGLFFSTIGLGSPDLRPPYSAKQAPII